MLLRCTSVGWAVSTGEMAGRQRAPRRRARCRPAQARQRHLDAALLGAAGALVHGAAADVVAVLGQVGQVLK
jgi:hypothetical protein